MGHQYGPHRGYWFPRERGAFHDLLTLLTDLTNERYETNHPLTGIMLQKWDSPSTEARPFQYTLGDQDETGEGLSQRDAAQDAVMGIRQWIQTSGQ